MKGIGIAIKTKDKPKDCNRDLNLSIGLNTKEINAHANLHINSDNETKYYEYSHASEIEFHMNFWKPDLKFCKSYKNFHIDFGIKFSSEVESIRIYIPFRLKNKKGWTDLGSVMTQNNQVLCSIFNERFSSNNIDKSCYYKVKTYKVENESSSFYLYTLGEDNINIYNDKDTKGTWIDIGIKEHSGIPKNELIYIRFRLSLKDARDFIVQKELSNNLIQAAFSKVDLIDVTLNDNNKIHEKVIEHLTTDGYNLCNFRKAHILFLSSSRVSIENLSEVKNTSKLIHPDIWMQYEPDKYYYDIFIGHHWKFAKSKIDGNSNQGNIIPKDIPIESINLFFTAKYPKVNSWTFISYVCVVLAFGALGSLLGSVEDSHIIPTLQYKIGAVFIIGLFISIAIMIWLVRNFRIILRIIPRPFRGWIINKKD